MKEQILKLKAENPTFGYKRIAREIGCTANTVRYHLDRKVQESVNKRNSRLRRTHKNILKSEFGGACQTCGYDRCLDVLHFHHKNADEKSDGVTFMLEWYGFEAAKAEATKCILLCANCHGELHSKLGTPTPTCTETNSRSRRE